MLEQSDRPYYRHTAISSMPIDKQQNGKPFTPALSSNFRHTKSPLTPRLAGSAPNSPASAQRREAFVRTRSPAREEPAAATSLIGNITPRSAARKSRIGTESPATPGSYQDANVSRPRAKSSAAPKPSPPPSAGLGISSPAATSSRPPLPRNPVTSSTPVYTIPRRVSGAKSAVQNDNGDDAKFFRADAAKSSSSLPGVDDKASTSPNDSQFFYVGDAQPQNVTSPKLSPSKNTQGNLNEKFFHAGDVRAQPAPRSSPRLNASVKSPGVSTVASRLQQPDRPRPAKSVSRGNSPHKPGPTPLQNVHAPQPTSPQRATFNSNVNPSAASSTDVIRRTSIGSNVSSTRPGTRIGGHTKSMSTSSLSGTPTRMPSVSKPTLTPIIDQSLNLSFGQSRSPLDRPPQPLLSPEMTSPRSTSLASSNTIGTSLGSECERAEAQKFPSTNSLGGTMASISSPTLDPTIPTSIDLPRPVSDQASNARRERKVLDLEISNSSLLAINKTLEREMRKQSVELRRFRRLSRSGRLSIAPTERTVSGSTLDTVAELDDEEDSDSEQEDDSDLDGLDEDILSNDSSSIQSPTSKQDSVHGTRRG